ncbi:TonB-dependent receptor [Proteobacteria bacterium 005FR1]|nr:TonB-dependent receptor [Proteobacteria bacterium 005FR1]
MDRKYLMTALGYGIVGLLLGIYMAASQNHGQFVTHAHILLVGFVVSFVYAVCHKLWLSGYDSTLVRAQYYAHQAGSLVLVAGLYMLYGGIGDEAVLGPVMGVASIAVLAGLVLMKLMIIKAGKATETAAPVAGPAA